MSTPGTDRAVSVVDAAAHGALEKLLHFGHRSDPFLSVHAR